MTFSAMPRSERFTTSSASTPTISIRLRPRLMRGAVRPERGVLAVLRVDSQEQVARVFTSTLADLIFPICSKAADAQVRNLAVVVFAIFFRIFSAEAGVDRPSRKKVRSQVPISNVR